jgi:hypothetical protein
MLSFAVSMLSETEPLPFWAIEIKAEASSKPRIASMGLKPPVWGRACALHPSVGQSQGLNFQNRYRHLGSRVM